MINLCKLTQNFEYFDFLPDEGSNIKLLQLHDIFYWFWGQKILHIALEINILLKIAEMILNLSIFSSF